jgi:hypothetical protein
VVRVKKKSEHEARNLLTFNEDVNGYRDFDFFFVKSDFAAAAFVIAARCESGRVRTGRV